MLFSLKKQQKMEAKKFALIFFAVIMALSAVSAFSIDSGSDVSICAGTTSTIIDTIIGDGSYSITSSGSASDFSTTIPSGLVITGQNAVYSYVSPPSTALPGEYALLVSIKNERGETKTAYHGISITDCHASVLSVDKDKTTCACEESAFLITLKNSGSYLESYNLFVEGAASKWATLSDSILIIGPGEEKSSKAFVKAPCDVYGRYELTFKAKASTSLSVATAKANIDIKPCYDYSLGIDKNYYSLCENEKISIPLKLNNLGTSDSDYDLKISGPDWMNIENSRMFVKSLQSSETNILANPPYLVKGNFTLNVEATSKIGGLKKTVESKINVEKCYDVLVDAVKEKDRLCNAVSNKYEVIIKNTGRFSNSYDLSINSDFATLSESRISLSAGEEKSVELDVHPSYDTSAKLYDITITATDPASKASGSDKINIQVSTLEQCYQPSIKAKTDNIALSKDSTATDLIIIENKGSDPATYILDLSGTASKFSELNPGIVTIAPGKAEAVYLYIAPNLLVDAGSYENIITARMKDTTILSSKTVSIKVNEGKEVEKQVQKIDVSLDSENRLKSSENKTSEAANKTAFIDNIGKFFSKIGTAISNAISSIKLNAKSALNATAEEKKAENITIEENMTSAETSEVITPAVEEKKVETISPAEEEKVENIAENITIEENITSSNETISNKTGFFDKIGQGFSRIGNAFSVAGKWTAKTAVNTASSVKGFFEDAINSLRPEEARIPSNMSVGEIKAGFIAGNITEHQLLVYFDDVNMSKESSQLFIDKWTAEMRNISEQNKANTTIAITTEQGASTASVIKEEVKDEQDTSNSQSNEEITIDLSINKSESDEQAASNAPNETLILETQNLSKFNPNLNLNIDFSKFKSYIIGAVVIILIMLLFITGAWKKIIEFFEEEVDEPKKNGKNGKKK